MQFKYYVLNYDWNAQKVGMYNVFRNIKVQEATEREIRKYLRSPKNYKGWRDKNLSGFEALCEEIRSIIHWQEWSRREYEISVGDAFEDDCNKLEKWDCYGQCEPNIPMITRECIYQYKQQKKLEKGTVQNANNSN